MNFERIKQSATGRCIEIIESLTLIPQGFATAREDVECPLCNHGSLHADRRDKGVDDHGRVRCHSCNGGRSTSDVIGTVQAFGGYASQGTAAKAIAKYLGLSIDCETGTTTEVDIVGAVAKAKRMPVDAFRKFGAAEAKRGRDQKPVARVPVHNESGEIHSHFDLTPRDKGFFKRGDGSAGLFFPGALPKPGETWHLVEGVKDAAALLGLGFKSCGLSTSHLATKYVGLFRDVDIVLVPDLDEVGQTGAQRSGGRLKGIAQSVRIARLPGEIVATKGDDVRDVIRQSGDEAVRTAIETAIEWKPRDVPTSGRDERPEETLTLRYAWHVDRVTQYLGQLGLNSNWIPQRKWESRKLYQRGGILVEVVTETKPDATSKGGRVRIAEGTPRIRPLPTQQLTLRIADACQLIKEVETKDGEIERKAVAPPKWLIEGIHTAGDYGTAIRHLESIVTAPTIRPDGSVLQTPGWDASGLLYRPSMKFEPIPDKPDKQAAQMAVKVLLDVMADFPFTDDADRSAWLAMLLSMIGRPCITGHVPMFCVSANVRGAGKSLLVDVASTIAYGHGAARTTYASDDDEMRKRVTSLIMEGSPAVLLDNIDRPIGGAALDAVLTAERWKDRELGSSRTIDLPARAIWTATGNNLRFRSDIARRVLPIRLDSPLERPETRSDFTHTDLLSWVRSNRGELVTAALTVLRAYFVEDCPKQSGGQFGSFEAWSDVIRGAIVWAGFADPMDTIETAVADDDSAAIVAGLIGGLLEVDESGDGLTAKEIIDHLNKDEKAERFPTMREVVADVANRNGRPDSRLLGNQLRKYRGRVLNGYRLTGKTGRSRRQVWYALPLKSGESGESGESSFTPPTHEIGCVSTDSSHDTHTYAYRDGPESDSSHSPDSPNPAITCPTCGIDLIPAEPVGGFQNFDCPGCGFVKPVSCGDSCR